MVKLATYSGEEYGERCVERGSKDPFVSDWRSSRLILVTSTNSDLMIKSIDSEIDRHGSLFGENRIETLQESLSETNLKTVHRTISEYWRQVLRYHWPIAIQSLFLVIVIMTMSPWVGLTCNEDISSTSNEGSLMWRFPIISDIKTAFDYSETNIPQPSCNHGYCCFSQNIEGSPTRRRASFLKRKRITKAFDDF